MRGLIIGMTVVSMFTCWALVADDGKDHTQCSHHLDCEKHWDILPGGSADGNIKDTIKVTFKDVEIGFGRPDLLVGYLKVGDVLDVSVGSLDEDDHVCDIPMSPVLNSIQEKTIEVELLDVDNANAVLDHQTLTCATAGSYSFTRLWEGSITIPASALGKLVTIRLKGTIDDNTCSDHPHSSDDAAVKSAEYSAYVIVPKVEIDRDGVIISGLTSDVIVGQRMRLKEIIKPPDADSDQGSTQWTVPGATVKSYTQTRNKGEALPLTVADLVGDALAFHWIDGGVGRDVTLVWSVGGIPFPTKATFNVGRPTATFTSELTSLVPAVDVRGDGVFNYGDAYLAFGPASVAQQGGTDGITYRGNVVCASEAGKIGFVQLFKVDSSIVVDGTMWPQKTPVPNTSVLDTYANQIVVEETAIAANSTKEIKKGDSPSSKCSGPKRTKLQISYMSFDTYLMYKPDGNDSIWVTLCKMPWAWAGVAEGNDMDETSWICTARSSPTSVPVGPDSAEIPTWTAAYNGSIVWQRPTP